MEFHRPLVRTVQAEVDRQRFEAMYESALAILRNERQAKLFAAWAVYLLVGYEQAILPPDTPWPGVDRRPTARLPRLRSVRLGARQ